MNIYTKILSVFNSRWVNFRVMISRQIVSDEKGGKQEQEQEQRQEHTAARSWNERDNKLDVVSRVFTRGVYLTFNSGQG